MSTQPANGSRPPDLMHDWFALMVLGIGGLLAVVWLGATSAALVFAQRRLGAGLQATVEAALRLPANWSDPRQAWAEPARTRLPGPVPYWLSTCLVLVAVVALFLVLLRLLMGHRAALDRRKRLGVEAQARLARPRDLRPLMVKELVAGRFVLGRIDRQILATENWRSSGGAWFRAARRRRGDTGALALVGPTRSGKSRAAARGIEAWRGPAILSSVKTDLLGATLDARAAVGEVKIFDPTAATGRMSAQWTPLAGSSTLQGAMTAAKALTEASPRSAYGENAYWLNQAEILLASLLWVAANAPALTIADVVDWVLAQDRPTDEGAGTIAPVIRALIDGEHVSARDAKKVQSWMRGLWEMDPRTSSSIYATARTVVWPWADPQVAEASRCCEIDLDWLLSGENTLYVCAPPNDEGRLAPVLGGLIGDLVNQAFQRSNRANAPLDPTLLIVLDEAANTPLRKLPEWASTVAGIGIQLVTVWQSKTQIDALYGLQADTILTNHLTKVFFAGMSDASGLAYVSQLLGSEHVPGVLEQELARPQQDRPSPTQVTLAPANVLRQMRPGEALLIHGTLPPAHVTTNDRRRIRYRNRPHR